MWAKQMMVGVSDGKVKQRRERTGEGEEDRSKLLEGAS